MGKQQHVVPRGKGWAVIGAGNSRATKITKTQKQAVDVATKIAKNHGAEVITHGRNGQIRSKDSYGNDPMPPRDAER